MTKINLIFKTKNEYFFWYTFLEDTSKIGGGGCPGCLNTSLANPINYRRVFWDPSPINFTGHRSTLNYSTFKNLFLIWSLMVLWNQNRYRNTPFSDIGCKCTKVIYVDLLLRQPAVALTIESLICNIVRQTIYLDPRFSDILYNCTKI